MGRPSQFDDDEERTKPGGVTPPTGATRHYSEEHETVFKALAGCEIRLSRLMSESEARVVERVRQLEVNVQALMQSERNRTRNNAALVSTFMVAFIEVARELIPLLRSFIQ